MPVSLDLKIDILDNKKLYFLSDIHLGSPNDKVSLERELKLIVFLDSIQKDAHSIFFVGDIFDFWFEYKHAVPKYFIRFFAKILELQQSNIRIYFLKGNHDLWMQDYISDYLNVYLVEDRIFLNCNDKLFFIAHGDGKGPGDLKYKILKKIFTNSLCKIMFRWLHPDIGIKLALTWSRSSFTNPADEVFEGEDKEWLVQYAKRKMQENIKANYFIFGHRHLPMQLQIAENTNFINLGDWLYHDTYAVFNGKDFELKEWKG
ncbi:MAG TPA: UDP-2,3-diacylglucosamine diphosphatase [Chitinophagales bacterium]|nr:UDP-2,3-diacylglucosamine diphosphatase [Chitinophagales bacterium]HMU98526.1 UDP-2,3-diacylglucosamine diphosphatase [Chitinophagales bacterium]HMV03408.1 UDP-2,3-diacylglucosamine diphosphatase [Chitinophagales bacterium]HMW95186.1 UDP-2,3-diacylglucosamine diphosphatase [Chitinophagales bacterium]HMY43181.1 UDP-2,3-diacylglucosamine diphosphatase [Chitinophagales bacterium]